MHLLGGTLVKNKDGKDHSLVAIGWCFSFIMHIFDIKLNENRHLGH